MVVRPGQTSLTHVLPRTCLTFSSKGSRRSSGPARQVTGRWAQRSADVSAPIRAKGRTRAGSLSGRLLRSEMLDGPSSPGKSRSPDRSRARGWASTTKARAVRRARRWAALSQEEEKRRGGEGEKESEVSFSLSPCLLFSSSPLLGVGRATSRRPGADRPVANIDARDRRVCAAARDDGNRPWCGYGGNRVRGRSVSSALGEGDRGGC